MRDVVWFCGFALDQTSVAIACFKARVGAIQKGDCVSALLQGEGRTDANHPGA